jgi:hypothetical protein
VPLLNLIPISLITHYKFTREVRASVSAGGAMILSPVCQQMVCAPYPLD